MFLPCHDGEAMEINEGKENHIAWRYFNNGAIAYVQSFSWSLNHKGDPYSYTEDATKAAKLTEEQCKRFCRYMRDCDTVGFWS